MDIDEVIQNLEAIKKKHGSIQVNVRNDWHGGEVKFVKDINILGKCVVELREESFYFNSKE